MLQDYIQHLSLIWFKLKSFPLKVRLCFQRVAENAVGGAVAQGNNMQGEQITVSVFFSHLLNLSDIITVAYILTACVRSSLQFIIQKNL